MVSLVLVLFNSLVESLDCLLELFLVIQQFSTEAVYQLLTVTLRVIYYPRIVVWLNSVREPLDDRPEGDHTAVLVALLVLRDRELDVAKDKVWLELGRLLVVCNRLVEVVHDEGDYRVSAVTFAEVCPTLWRALLTLSSVVVDIWVFRVVPDSSLKVAKARRHVAW